jgi:rRNA 2'-O-methyltransferase fibrillarin
MRNYTKYHQTSRIKLGREMLLEEHQHEGVFIARGKVDALVTRSLTPGCSLYGEKRIQVETVEKNAKNEYRIWNPYVSKLAAAILGGVDCIFIKPGSKVLYLGAASGVTVSHVSDVIGIKGFVYAVEFSRLSSRELLSITKKRPNIVPIVEDARFPERFRMLVGMVDVIYCDLAQPDQAQIMRKNADFFLKNGGHFITSVKASHQVPRTTSEELFSNEITKLQALQLRPREQLTLDPYERDHAIITGTFLLNG